MAKTRIPKDILIEIMSRLPVKSLVRFRCVSKSWANLISNPDFVNLHLTRSIQNHSKILFPTYDDTYTIDYQTPCYQPKPCNFPLNDQLLIGSCNGLICVSNKVGYMALWNPATKEDVELDYTCMEDEEEDEPEVVMGFGYDPLLHQYKTVRCVFFFRDTEFHKCKVEVCTLGTGEWRRIADPPCRLHERHMVPLVNEALHWLGGSPIGGSNSFDHKIISFDIRTEEFRVVPWIESILDTDSDDVTIGVLQGCLSALLWYGRDSGIHVWMMKDYGVKESWTKLFSVQMPAADTVFGSMEPLVLRENGEMIFKSWGQVYIYNGIHHTLVATYCICDLPGPQHCYQGHMYAESLVSIESLVCPD